MTFKKDTSFAGMYKAFSGYDYEDLGNGLYHCPKLSLWWKAGTTYDELSASHNGLIGTGAYLKNIISGINHE